MKKLLNATLAAVLSFSLIGCSNKSTTSQKDSTTATTENTAETKAEETKYPVTRLQIATLKQSKRFLTLVIRRLSLKK